MVLAAFLLIQLFPWHYTIDGHIDSRDYEWVQILPAGSGKEEHVWVEGAWPRLYTNPVVRGDTVFMFGEHFTFISVDGKHWHRQRHSGRWGKRYGAAHVVFRNRFWILGGMKTWDSFENDIWVSNDGYAWTLAARHAPWSERRGHAVFEHRGSLFLVGGAESSGIKDVLPTQSLGDVWSTENGIAWNSTSDDAPWIREFSRDFYSTKVLAQSFQERLWVFGGTGNVSWYSLDGQRWHTIQGDEKFSPREGAALALFDGRLWVFGGVGRNDVWHTGDGKFWAKADDAPWSKRAPGPLVAFRSGLLVFGGKTGKSADLGDDLWMLKKSQSKP